MYTTRILRLSIVVLLVVLSACAPSIRRGLRRTIESLPADPSGTEMLIESDRDHSGTDCIAYAKYRLYGTNADFEDIVDYYLDKLVEDDWEPPNRKDSLEAGIVGFSKGTSDYVVLYSPDHKRTLEEIERTMDREELRELEIQQYKTVYLLTVSHTCGYSERQE